MAETTDRCWFCSQDRYKGKCVNPTCQGFHEGTYALFISEQGADDRMLSTTMVKRSSTELGTLRKDRRKKISF